MSRRELDLISKAKKRFCRIVPVGGRRRFADCFTRMNGQLYFWFDTPDHSTHVIAEDQSVR